MNAELTESEGAGSRSGGIIKQNSVPAPKMPASIMVAYQKMRRLFKRRHFYAFPV